MTGLLVKDLRLMLQRMRFFLFLLILAIAWGFSSEGGAEMVTGYLVMIMAMFCISSMSYDEYDNCYPFLLTLPVDRKTYVREKYVFGAMLTCVGWVTGALIYFVGLLGSGETAGIGQNVLLTAPYMAIGILILDLSIPFQLKYGMERGRMAMIVAVIAVVAVAALADTLTRKAGVDIGSLLEQVLGGVAVAPVMLAVLFVLLLCALTFLSVTISGRIVKKKDF